jgi:hypothetical protein
MKFLMWRQYILTKENIIQLFIKLFLQIIKLIITWYKKY